MTIPVIPGNTHTLNIPWAAAVTRADPDWRRAAQDVVEFEFDGGKRIFKHNPSRRGPYAED
jgi:hypothetical protein